MLKSAGTDDGVEASYIECGTTFLLVLQDSATHRIDILEFKGKMRVGRCKTDNGKEEDTSKFTVKSSHCVHICSCRWPL